MASPDKEAGCWCNDTGDSRCLHGSKMAWLSIIRKGIAQWGYKALAPFVVPFLDEKQRKYHTTYGIYDATDFGYWNVAIRNGAWNYRRRPMPKYTTTGNALGMEDQTLERLDGFQWRRRQAIVGDYVSFRMTWGKARDKGKREFYIGWTMRPRDKFMGLTFFQLRVF